MTEPLLETRDLHVAIAGARVVRCASLAVRPGELVALIGPNGAGKTTLLRAALGLVPAAGGAARLDGRDVAELSAADVARAAAYLPQARPLAWPAPVRDVVALGRFAHGARLDALGPADAAAVARAISACGLGGFEDRPSDALSGGELARVHLARALAAEAPLLVADEPTANLDPRAQHETMARLRAASRGPRAAFCVVHDLTLAARYADRLVWMRGGGIVADGAPAETMTAARLARVFGVEARVAPAPDGSLAVAIDGPRAPSASDEALIKSG
ncbi:MAG: ABC transporter ATP-binding protein [Parvularculaceae bacterium]